MELNNLAQNVQFHGLYHEILPFADTRLFCPMKLDLRVVIIWDTDMTDVGIEVMEPSGDKCYAFNNKTSDGMLSRDFTHGYGPQEYLLKTARPGTYKIFVNLNSSMQKYTGTTIFVQITTHFGSVEKERKYCTSIQLHNDNQKHLVAKVVFS